MISSPYCAVSGFVFVFVLNYFVDMLHFGNSIHEVFESAITGRYVYKRSMSFNICLGCVEALLLVIIVWKGYLALIMKKKVSLSQNFYLGCVYIPSCEAHKHCRAEIAQYRLEIIFKALQLIFYAAIDC